MPVFQPCLQHSCGRHHPRQNIHPAPHQWPLWHSQRFLQGTNPKQPPWLWFNNRVIVHNRVDFALFIPVLLYFLQTCVHSQTRHSLQTSLKQTSHLAKQKSCRGPRLKCFLQESGSSFPWMWAILLKDWDLGSSKTTPCNQLTWAF